MLVGTIHYLSLEQISGKDLSVKSDIYSIGVIFYEILTGRKPFLGETTVDILRQIINKEPLPISIIRKDVPIDLNDLIMTMLSKKPDDRPSSDTVATILSGIPIED